MDRLIKLTGELDRYHGFGKLPVLPPAEDPPPRRLTGPRRELPAPNSAPPETEAKLFLGCKALKCHETGLESVN